MADIVLHGLGDGPYVTNGLGHVTPPTPGAMAAYVACGASVTASLTADGGTGSTVDMAATISATATVTATLSATDGNPAPESDPTVGSIARLGGWRPQPVGQVVDMAAVVVGFSHLSATAVADYNDDLATVLMLLDLDLMLTEGVTL